MTIATQNIRNWVASTGSTIFSKAVGLKNAVLARLDHYIPREKEVEKKTWTEREIQEIHWNTMTLDGPVGIKEWEAYSNNKNNNFISKVMNTWNKYTGLTYLSQKLENLSETHNIRLYKHTSKLLFKNSDNVVKKIGQVLSSVFGITHVSLITTLFINKLFPSIKKEDQSEPKYLHSLKVNGNKIEITPYH